MKNYAISSFRFADKDQTGDIVEAAVMFLVGKRNFGIKTLSGSFSGRVSPFASCEHGITDDDISGLSTFSASPIKMVLEEAASDPEFVIVVHDKKQLQHFIKEENAKCKIIDTKKLSLEIWKDAESTDLRYLRYLLKLNTSKAGEMISCGIMEDADKSIFSEVIDIKLIMRMIIASGRKTAELEENLF